ncbi:MAG: cysteine hydrolase [Burkholderiales bacterium]|nr:cysteine hydrolase [Burkholderiales bacterium]
MTSRSAVLLMDLQTDFLAPEGAKMPVAANDAECIVATANQVFGGTLLDSALRVVVVNRFPRSARIANFFRRHAAVDGSTGAELDRRLQPKGVAKIIAKAAPSAFSNPELDALLKSAYVAHIYIFGVFAEGCVRSTALDALRRGYAVTVPVDAIGTNADWKRAFALWSMRRAGVALVPTLPGRAA